MTINPELGGVGLFLWKGSSSFSLSPNAVHRGLSKTVGSLLCLLLSVCPQTFPLAGFLYINLCLSWFSLVCVHLCVKTVISTADPLFASSQNRIRQEKKKKQTPAPPLFLSPKNNLQKKLKLWCISYNGLKKCNTASSGLTGHVFNFLAFQ